MQAHYQNSKAVQPIREISYPLPKPNYFGHPITEIILFVHNLNILENINLMAQNYSLRFRTLEGKEGKELPIVSKNYFYNESFKIPLIPWNEVKPEREDSRIIYIEIVRKGAEEVELVGKF